MPYTPTTTTADLIAAQWSKDFFRYGMHNMFFGKFIGNPLKIGYTEQTPSTATILTDPNALIQMKMEMNHLPGDGITFPIVPPLTGHGRVATTGAPTTGSLEAHEEGILNYAWKATLKQWGHATKDINRLTRKHAAFEWDSIARMSLAQWFGRALDEATYSALAGLAYVGDDVTPGDVGGSDLVAQATPSRKLTGGMTAGTYTSRVTDAVIGVGEFMCLEMISDARRLAVLSEPTIRPIIIDGQPWYMMFLSPMQCADLKNNAGVSTGYTWGDAQMYAAKRGPKNPLFTHAMGAWDGVLLYEYQGCASRLGDGAGAGITNTFDGADVVTNTVTANRALFCGACAAVHAYGSMPKFVRKDFDYEMQHGLSVQTLIDVGRPEFNAVDYGVMVVDSDTR